VQEQCPGIEEEARSVLRLRRRRGGQNDTGAGAESNAPASRALTKTVKRNLVAVSEEQPLFTARQIERA
jgi:hypothetical protein